MKYTFRTLKFLLLGLVLARCSPAFEGGELEAQTFLKGKRWVSDSVNVFEAPNKGTEADYNCVATDVYSEEQGRLKGFSGGLTYSRLEEPTTPKAMGKEFREKFFATFRPSIDTKILIVDDFGDNKYKLPLFQNYGSIESLLRSGQYSHGALVMYHANEAVKGSGLYKSGLQEASGQTVHRSYARYFKTLTVAPVNVQLASREATIKGVTVNLIRTNVLVTKVLLDKAKQYFFDSNPNIFNMSFGIVPCEIYADFENSKLGTFSEYIEAFVKKNYSSYATDNNKKVNTNAEKIALTGIMESTNLSGDPLRKLIDDEADSHIFVAAAGNYGVEASMYPANWTGVINVTGSNVKDRYNRLKSEFNRGEVMTVGSLFETEPSKPNARKLYYYGTSFATPSVSVFSALDLVGLQRCAATDTDYKSELAIDLVPLGDIVLERAVQTRCDNN